MFGTVQPNRSLLFGRALPNRRLLFGTMQPNRSLLFGDPVPNGARTVKKKNFRNKVEHVPLRPILRPKSLVACPCFEWGLNLLQRSPKRCKWIEGFKGGLRGGFFFPFQNETEEETEEEEGGCTEKISRAIW